MTDRALDRRGFLALSGAAVAAAALTACSGGSSQPDVDIGALRRIYSEREALERIGKHAVEATGVGGHARDLAATLSPDGSAAWLSRASVPTVRSHLRTQIAADFTNDRIVDVAGWQLPLTEARVAALVYATR